MSESYILCEGYHDRAFWAGLLMHAGCVDPGVAPDGRRAQVLDAFGVPVRSPTFAFRSRSNRFIRVVPAQGKDEIPRLVRNRLAESVVKPLTRLVVNYDSDLRADNDSAVGTPVSRQGLIDLIRNFDPSLNISSHDDLEVAAGQTRISLLAWGAADPPSTGLPHQQTLERLICAAIISVYPNRAPAVQNWLDTRPGAPPAGAKEFAWSYLAGWHASVGSYEGFCSMLWKDERVAEQLRRRLEAAGIWRVAAEIAS